MALIPQRGTPTPHFKPAGANEADTFNPRERVGTQGDRNASDLVRGPVFAAPRPGEPADPHLAQRSKLIALLHLMLSTTHAAPPGAVAISSPVTPVVR